MEGVQAPTKHLEFGGETKNRARMKSKIFSREVELILFKTLMPHTTYSDVCLEVVENGYQRGNDFGIFRAENLEERFGTFCHCFKYCGTIIQS